MTLAEAYRAVRLHKRGCEGSMALARAKALSDATAAYYFALRDDARYPERTARALADHEYDAAAYAELLSECGIG